MTFVDLLWIKQEQFFQPTECCVLLLCADASDLDSVSHGSLDSTNDSAERASIDTDFTKMDSSDDGSSTGALSALILGHLCLFTYALFVSS